MAIHFHLVWLLPPALWMVASAAEGAPLHEGRLSQVVRDVRLVASAAKPVAAAADAVVRDGSVQTGSNSRAEISFPDQTVVRLGDKTIVGVESGTRTFELQSGAILTQVPSGVGGTTLKVRGITATATGTTLAVECLPNAYTKFIALEGTSRLCLKKAGWGSDCILLRAGQMVIASPEPKALPDAVDVDLGRLLDTCQFITEFSRLPGQDRLAQAAATQRKGKTHGNFAETNLVIFGRGTLVTQRAAGNDSPATTTPATGDRPNGSQPPTQHSPAPSR